jgi:hypothetical protein
MQQTLSPEMDPQAFGNLSGASVSENSCHVLCAEWFVIEGSSFYPNRMWLTMKLLFLLFRFREGPDKRISSVHQSLSSTACSHLSLLPLRCPDVLFCPLWPEFLHRYLIPSGKWQASHQYKPDVLLVIKCCNKDSIKPHCAFPFCMVIFCKVTILL